LGTIPKPGPDEYPPFYAGYVTKADQPDILQLLQDQITLVQETLRPLSESEARYRYAPGKWSIKELVGHITDAERIFGYRTLRIARGDQTPLAGFDENAFVAGANFDERSLASLLAEFQAARTANLALLTNLPAEVLNRRGIANGSPISVRALIYIIAGHVEHHRTILRDRYQIPGPEGLATG
jgi:hypothetical protein